MSKSSANKALKYSGIATEMFVAVGLGAWAGNALDKYWELKKFPVFTVLFIFLGLSAVFYRLFKTLQQDSQEQEESED